MASAKTPVCVTALLATLLLGTACGGATQNAPQQASTGRLFAANSVWNAPLASNAALDPRSNALIGWLDGQVEQEFHSGHDPFIQTVTDSTPIYVVPRNQPAVRVALENSASWGRSLAQALEAVPIPAGARPATGSDAHITIWQPSTDSLWELFEARHTAAGWQAAWGGAIRHVSHSPGYYTSASWPGAQPGWGATATSLPAAAGTMTISELQRGTIDHALAIALPNARADSYSWPAQRTDGTDPDPSSIPEGAHLRLDPRLNIASLHLPRALEAIALAAQRYGLIVRDKTGESVALYAQVPTGGGDPYTQVFGGTPVYDLLKRFPWDSLEVLRMRLHSGTGS